MGGGSSAPDPDKNVGRAALMNAETGENYLDYMKSQASISNAWAKQDRARYQNIFVPLEDELVEDAQTWDTRWRRNQRANQMEADVLRSIAGQQATTDRQLSAMGVNPASGRSLATRRSNAISAGLARAGARTIGRQQVQQEGEARMASAVNMGRGMAVNPATSLGLSNNAASSGFQGAMSGYTAQGNLLNQDYQNRMQAWSADQQSQASLLGGLGQLAGFAFMSSRKVKENKRPPERSLLKQVREAPVEQWKYKDGVEDGGEHIGSYAEDVSRASGGTRPSTHINVMDEIGTTKGAVQELDKQVQGMARDMKAIRRSLPQMKRAA